MKLFRLRQHRASASHSLSAPLPDRQDRQRRKRRRPPPSTPSPLPDPLGWGLKDLCRLARASITCRNFMSWRWVPKTPDLL